ncbi:hypothetical protein GCM10027447_25130 [Glycomyces halotolerans]
MSHGRRIRPSTGPLQSSTVRRIDNDQAGWPEQSPREPETAYISRAPKDPQT